MHLGLSTLLEFYRAHQADEALVLGTVIATEGSTYRKAGAMMLIADDSSYRGLISGGCLEADLASHAQEVFADGKTRNVCYDMSHGDDFAWGLGLGCDGIIQLMLQRLDGTTGFGFLETLDQAWQAKSRGLLSQHIALDRIDAAILMTHHLEHDRHYLSQVVEAAVSYIGLLGPRARRDRLLGETGATNVHVHGPAGLDIGAEMPASIALSIIAEIHAFLNQRDGAMLSRKNV